MTFKKLLAIDPSLTCSGWALFEIDSKRLLGVGTVKTLDSSHPLADRLAKLQQNVARVFAQTQLIAGDILICEDATSMKDPAAAAKLEQVRGIFETLGRDLGASVPGRIHPRSVQYEIVGMRGQQFTRDLVKFAAAQTVKQLFTEDLKRINFDISLASIQKSPDIVDALLLGSLGLSRIACAQRAGVSLASYFDAQCKSKKLRRVIAV